MLTSFMRAAGHGAGCFGLLGAKGFQPLAQGRIFVGQQRHRKQRRVGGPGVANGKGGHRDALGHLHDAVQRIHALQVLAGHRHAQHGHRGLGRHHARQVGRAPGPR
jgi:hypothetical protein